jgi:hypothetical protein
MTLPITIPIGYLGAAAPGGAAPRDLRLVSREVRFVAPRACRLGRLHVDRAPRAAADQRGIAAVLSDVEIELRDTEDEDRIVALVERRDRLLEHIFDRAWEPTREVTISAIAIDGKELDFGAPAMILSDPGRSSREVLPLSSGILIRPGQTAEITARPQRVSFRPDRFFVAGTGTPGGAGDWIVVDIRIGNRSQLSRAGEISGEMFATSAIDAAVSFDVVQTAMDVHVLVRYVGPIEEGVPFYGSMAGVVADGWTGIEIAAGAKVSLRIHNVGLEGEFRAVWLADDSSLAPGAFVRDLDLDLDGDFEDELTPLPVDDDDAPGEDD